MFKATVLSLVALPALVLADGFHPFGTYAGCVKTSSLPSDRQLFVPSGLLEPSPNPGKVISPYWCSAYCRVYDFKEYSYFSYFGNKCYCSSTGQPASQLITATTAKGYCHDSDFNFDLTTTPYEFSDCFSGYKVSGGQATTSTQSGIGACLTACNMPSVAFQPSTGKCICPSLGQTVAGSGTKICTASTIYLYTNTLTDTLGGIVSSL
ncbi:hypothetical protein BD324DRAFT_666434 [Kockovaella imperatae]|uniref:WSC domain-containing protein n=1 Tax=Kockovaella imperatae TaxID=4999 RepID=A0A1Y1U7V4_9TREE|nr:hypothetical protein BD324DRAFT_666434 [Kockovaella imperatae]ORX33587.1 hypothetical protein BD324DRAFT_666434 [Kockovaella imperatae]